MHRVTHRIAWVAIAALAIILGGYSVAQATPPTATYEVKVTNLTSGQPFTPPLIATHRQPFLIFQNGQPASAELQQIAENGDLTPMEDELSDNKQVHDFKIALAMNEDPIPDGPLLPGDHVVATLEATQDAKWLSIVSMLVCTNDGFTGLSGLKLPKDIGESAMIYADAYDAGTEINTEDFADIVPPCPILTGVPSDDPGTGMSNPELAENGVIHHHEGVQGFADLDPAIHNWENPVAKIVVTRID